MHWANRLPRLLQWLPAIVAFGIFVAAMAVLIHAGDAGGLAIDWRTYEAAAERFLDKEPIYSEIQLAGPYRFGDAIYSGYVYPPPSVLLFVPFAFFGYPIWAIVNVVLLASGLIAAGRVELRRHSPLVLTLVLAGLTFLDPLHDGLLTGNANVGIAGVFAWAWTLGRGRAAVPGAVLGLIKVAPGALVAWTTQPQFLRSVAVAAVVAAGIVVVTLPLVGLQSWFDYVVAVRNAVALCEPTRAGVVPLSCALGSVLGTTGVGPAIVVAGALAIAAVFVRSNLLSYALVLAASIAPLAEVHPHLFVFPFVLVSIAGFCALARFERRQADGGEVSPAGSPFG